MTWLTHRSRVYEQIHYNGERDFLPIVKDEIPKILPDFAILDFCPYIIGDEGSRRKPDLALVDRNYGMWAVVEVELEKHSLKHHVIPQIRAFATGRYDKSHAEMLHEKDPSLDLEALDDLITYSLPEILVIVNSRSVLNDGWSVLESDYSAHLTFLESFRAMDGDVIFSISGHLPTPPPSQTIKLTKCKMLNALVCAQPNNIPAGIGDYMCIYWNERPFMWKILRTADSVVLIPSSGFTVRADRNYQVSKINEERYQLYML